MQKYVGDEVIMQQKLSNQKRRVKVVAIGDGRCKRLFIWNLTQPASCLPCSKQHAILRYCELPIENKLHFSTTCDT